MALFLGCIGHDAHAETAPAPQGELRLVTEAEAILVPRYDALDIAIDGKLDEPVWQEVAGYDNMVVIEPETLVPTRFRTVAQFLYTDRGLYVGVWNEQPPETLIARLSSRDEDISRDSWGITLDTSGEGLYGYWFTVNLGGSVMDGKVLPERKPLVGMGRTVARRDGGASRWLERRTVPAVVNDDHATRRRRTDHGFLCQAQGRPHKRTLGLARPSIEWCAIHVCAPADEGARCRPQTTVQPFSLCLRSAG